MALGNDPEFHECPRIEMKAIMSANERGGEGVLIAAIHAFIERRGIRAKHVEGRKDGKAL